MIYFTSDNHLARGGDGKADIEKWRARVGENDTVYIAGDLFSANMRSAVPLIRQLGGRKILILGNNDPYWLGRLSASERAELFEDIRENMTLCVAGHTVELCHVPRESSCDILICGHIHTSRLGKGYAILKNSSRAFNAGVMICEGAPVSFADLVKYNEAFYKRKHSPDDDAVLKEIGEAFERM